MKILRFLGVFAVLLTFGTHARGTPYYSFILNDNGGSGGVVYETLNGPVIRGYLDYGSAWGYLNARGDDFTTLTQISSTPTTTLPHKHFAGYQVNDIKVIDRVGSFILTYDTLHSFNENNTQLIAIWNPNSYLITLDDDGATTQSQVHSNSAWRLYERYGDPSYTAASVLNTEDLDSADYIMTIHRTPTKTGYDFGGYYTAKNGSGNQIINAQGEIVGSTTQFTAPATIYAKWTPKILTVTLNSGTGSTPASPTTVYLKYGNGWFRDSGATRSISQLDSNPQRNGFTGFYTGTNASGTRVIDSNGNFLGTQSALTALSENGTVYAYFENGTPQIYTITLNQGGGTGGNSGPIYYKAGNLYSDSNATTQITTVALPTKTGYTFNGYYSAASGDVPQCINTNTTNNITGSCGVTGNTTWYARWTETSQSKIIVRYICDDAPGEYVDESAVYGTTYTVQPYAILDAYCPAPTGYMYTGWVWSEDNSLRSESSTISNFTYQNTTFTLSNKNITGKSYKILYYCDAEATVYGTQDGAIYGQSYQPLEYEDICSGQDFSTWVLKNPENGCVTSTPGAVLNGDVSPQSPPFTWEYDNDCGTFIFVPKFMDTNTISYNKNGGNWASNAQHPGTYTPGTAQDINAYLTRANSTHIGWCRNAGLTQNCSTDRKVHIYATDTGPLSFWAKFECNPNYIAVGNQCVQNIYTITYDLNGGAQSSGNQSDYPSSYNNSTGTTVNGGATIANGAFLGWCLNSNDAPSCTPNAVPYAIPSGVGGNITLSAKWKCDEEGGYEWNDNTKTCDKLYNIRAKCTINDTLNVYEEDLRYNETLNNANVGIQGGIDSKCSQICESNYHQEGYNVYYDDPMILNDTISALPQTIIGGVTYGNNTPVTFIPNCVPDTYNISYVLNGGNWPTSAGCPTTGCQNSYTYGIGATISVVPERLYSDFLGWCTDAALTDCSDSQTISTSDTGNKTFYAKFECDSAHYQTGPDSCEPCPSGYYWNDENCETPCPSNYTSIAPFNWSEDQCFRKCTNKSCNHATSDLIGECSWGANVFDSTQPGVQVSFLGNEREGFDACNTDELEYCAAGFVGCQNEYKEMLPVSSQVQFNSGDPSAVTGSRYIVGRRDNSSIDLGHNDTRPTIWSYNVKSGQTQSFMGTSLGNWKATRIIYPTDKTVHPNAVSNQNFAGYYKNASGTNPVLIGADDATHASQLTTTNARLVLQNTSGDSNTPRNVYAKYNAPDTHNVIFHLHGDRVYIGGAVHNGTYTVSGIQHGGTFELDASYFQPDVYRIDLYPDGQTQVHIWSRLVGWCTDDYGNGWGPTCHSDPRQIINIDADVHLYAQWECVSPSHADPNHPYDACVVCPNNQYWDPLTTSCDPCAGTNFPYSTAGLNWSINQCFNTCSNNRACSNSPLGVLSEKFKINGTPIDKQIIFYGNTADENDRACQALDAGGRAKYCAAALNLVSESVSMPRAKPMTFHYDVVTPDDDDYYVVASGHINEQNQVVIDGPSYFWSAIHNAEVQDDVNGYNIIGYPTDIAPDAVLPTGQNFTGYYGNQAGTGTRYVDTELGLNNTIAGNLIQANQWELWPGYGNTEYGIEYVTHGGTGTDGTCPQSHTFGTETDATNCRTARAENPQKSQFLGWCVSDSPNMVGGCDPTSIIPANYAPSSGNTIYLHAKFECLPPYHTINNFNACDACLAGQYWNAATDQCDNCQNGWTSFPPFNWSEAQCFKNCEINKDCTAYDGEAGGYNFISFKDTNNTPLSKQVYFYGDKDNADLVSRVCDANTPATHCPTGLNPHAESVSMPRAISVDFHKGQNGAAPTETYYITGNGYTDGSNLVMQNGVLWGAVMGDSQKDDNDYAFIAYPTFVAPNATTVSGNQFSGYYNAINGGNLRVGTDLSLNTNNATLVAATDSGGVGSRRDLYAQYNTLGQCNYTYYQTPGISCGGSGHFAYAGDNYTIEDINNLQSCAVTGYTFNGWKWSKDDAFHAPNTTVLCPAEPEDSTFTAKWCQNCWDNFNGNTCVLTPSVDGTCHYQISCATGYVPTGGTSTTPQTCVPDTGIEYKITYDCNSNNGGIGDSWNEGGIYYGDSVTANNNQGANYCIHPQYPLNVWNVLGTGDTRQPGEQFQWQYTSDKIFQATYDTNNPVTYSFNYSCGDGHGNNPPAAQNGISYGATHYLQTQGGCLNNGQEFQGWKVTVNNSEHTYDGGAQFDWTAQAIPRNRTYSFVAQWGGSINYTLTYSCGTGLGTAPDTQYNITWNLPVTASNNIRPTNGNPYCYHRVCELTQWADDGTNGLINLGHTFSWNYNSNQTFTADWPSNCPDADKRKYGFIYECGDGHGDGWFTERNYVWGSDYTVSGQGYCQSAGHAFNGWKLRVNGITSQNVIYPTPRQFDWDALTDDQVPEDRWFTFVADWNPDLTAYTMTYKPGTGATGNDVNRSIHYNEQFEQYGNTTTGFVKSGHILTSWFNQTEPGEYETIGEEYQYLRDGDTTLMAVWTACPAGTEPNSTYTQCVPCSAGTYSPDGVACIPCEPGYTSNAGAAACDILETYHYTYNCGDGHTNGVTPVTYDVHYNGTVVVKGPNDDAIQCSDNGWAFEYWELRKANNIIDDNVVPGNYTWTDDGDNDDNYVFVAQWSTQGNQYTVTYNCGTGTGSGRTDTAVYNTTYTVLNQSDTNCTKPGYTFTGWLFSGDSNVHNGGDTFNWTYPDNNQTFIAQWSTQGNQYIVTYKPGAGEGTDQVRNVWYNQPFTTLTPTTAGFSKDGYIMTRWNNETTSGVYEGVGQSYPYETVGDTEMTAIWAACPAGEQPNNTSTACEPCPDGWISPTAGGTCEPCDAGSTSNASHTECEPCAAGTYWNNGICEPCPTGYTSLPGTPSDEQCFPIVIECDAPNATLATRTWDSAKREYGKCTVITCDSGYHISANVCVLDDGSCAVPHGHGMREWNGTAWGECTDIVCDAGYEVSGNTCVECGNRRDDNGDIAVSTYSQGCEIAACMYQGQKYALNGDRCELICEQRSDDTGEMRWDASRKKCVRTCNQGYKMW